MREKRKKDQVPVAVPYYVGPADQGNLSKVVIRYPDGSEKWLLFYPGFVAPRGVMMFLLSHPGVEFNTRQVTKETELDFTQVRDFLKRAVFRCGPALHVRTDGVRYYSLCVKVEREEM